MQKQKKIADVEPLEPIPVYGTIPYLGGEWTVNYDVTRERDCSRHDLSGCGDFPFDRFPNIPVIDFRTAPNTEAVFNVINLPDSVRPKCVNTLSYKGTLEGFLDAVQDLGIKVINYAD